MSVNLRVGMKVVCVNATPQPDNLLYGLDGLTKGKVYTVRAVGLDNGCSDGVLWVWLLEIQRPIIADLGDDLWGERGYLALRFRPIVSKTQEEDTAMFKDIASKAPPKAAMTSILNNSERWIEENE